MSDRDATDKWVARLNQLGRKLDDDAACIHPSAWAEQLADARRQWRELAKRGER